MGREPAVEVWLLAALMLACPLLFGAACAKKQTSKSTLLRIDGDTSLDRGLGAQVQQLADVNDDGLPDIIAASPFEGLGEIGVYSGLV